MQISSKLLQNIANKILIFRVLNKLVEIETKTHMSLAIGTDINGTSWACLTCGTGLLHRLRVSRLSTHWNFSGRRTTLPVFVKVTSLQ